MNLDDIFIKDFKYFQNREKKFVINFIIYLFLIKKDN